MQAEKEETIMYEAEGQSFGAVGAVIALIIGVGVSVMVLIFVGVLGGQTYQLQEAKIDEIGEYVASNSAFTGNNATAQSLGHPYVESGTLTITNSTITIGNGNFTIDYTAGTALLKASGAEWNGSTLYASYTYHNDTIREYVKDGVISSFSALKQTGDYLPIIVLAVIISLVLMLVLSFTAFSGKGGSNTAL